MLLLYKAALISSCYDVRFALSRGLIEDCTVKLKQSLEGQDVGINLWTYLAHIALLGST